MSSDAERHLVRRNRRPVIDENGDLYPSVIAAAAARGVAAPTAWTKARLQRGGWRFANEPPRQPASPASTREG